VKRLTLAAGTLVLAACAEPVTSPERLTTRDLGTVATLSAGHNTVKVREADITRQAENTAPTSSWVYYTRTSGTLATGTFVAGPATPPAGNGSFQISTPDGTAKATIFNYDHFGTALSDIDAIAYSTYRTAGSLQQVASLNVQVDANGADAGGFTTLVFEPVYNTGQGTVTNDTWQSWDAFNGGNGVWWSSNAIPGAPNRDTFVSWSTIVANNPNAVVLAVGINQGSGNPALTTSVDAFRIGYGGNSITYDFEDSGCHFTTNGSTWDLEGDCETTSTILIPNGLTLDGNGYTITAKDPAGGHFLGAVIRNGGTTAGVVNLTVTSSGLADACDAGDNRLRGILFDGASGVISGNTVTGVRQGLSGCQEGNAIEARNAPFAGETGPVTVGPDVNVTISNNTVTNYMKNGITTNGAVNATITGNLVTGDGPITYTAQNGIQVGFGATAIVKSNTVSGNNYTPASYEACGLLLYRADGVKAQANSVFENEKNQCNYGKGSANVKASN
jgi:hypothetical protein